MIGERTVVGDYVLEERLGRGGMGTVFRARHRRSGRVVALKLLADGALTDLDLAARLEREGRIQASLEHPHVVTVYEAGTSEHGVYLAMAIVDGPPLAALIAQRTLGVRRALGLLDQVADALDAAHAAGLVHRDVKPHNVLVGAGDHAFLADFGLTSAVGAAGLTAAGTIVGTVAYLAPEVVEGAAASAASDRYAFAAMAFECLTGTVVFPRSTDAAALFALVNDPPPRIGARRPELGGGLDELFARALDKDPGARPAAARELLRETRRRLERSGAIDLPAPAPTGLHALGEVTATTPVTARAAGGVPSRARRRVGWAATGAGVLLVAAVATVALTGGADVAPADVTPPEPGGLRYLGADLGGAAGRPLDCLGGSRQPDSAPCTVVQSRLPGATLVVPEDGVIRRWAVRGAQGELTLAVLRPRDGGAFQLALSGTETVGSADVQGFETDLAVERGDLVGLRVTPGSAIGVRPGTPGARTERWVPPLSGPGRPAERGAGTGFDHELLLRVGLLPGGERRAPRQVTGSAARRLPAGRERARRSVRLSGRDLAVVLVEVAGRLRLDLLDGGRRVARLDVPDVRPDAELVRFVAEAYDRDGGGLDLHAVNADSGRVIQHFYALTARQFEAVR